MNETIIHRTWRQLNCVEKLGECFGEDVSLDQDHMKCLKDSYKSSIWSLRIKGTKQSHPIILKVFKPRSRKRAESAVEIKMYRKASKFLQDFMPTIYMRFRVPDYGYWVFMEHVPQQIGHDVFTPKHFNYIIPTLAKLHAHTFNSRFTLQNNLFGDWLPCYLSKDMMKERKQTNKETKKYLDAAMNRPDLQEILKPSYALLHILLQKGPYYFPEMNAAGQSIIHSDLSLQNIGSNHINNNWKIKFIDWEGATFAPCWFDLVNLVGVFLGRKAEWKAHEEAVIRHCARMYANEMKKHGISFETDPVKLYQMAQLQHILERGLYLQLSWEVNGRKKGVMLQGYIEKINGWGKELGLH